jgi:hypothetical protein
MRQKHVIRYNDIEDFNKQCEEWKKANPKAREVEQQQDIAKYPSLVNGLFEGTITYVED